MKTSGQVAQGQELFDRASRLHRAGRVPEALALYDRAVALLPSEAALHNNRGIALAQLGRFDAALASYRCAVAVDPDHADAHVNLGLAEAQRGDFDAAVAGFDRALALRPGHAAAVANRAAALAARAAADIPQAAADRHNSAGIEFAAAGDLSAALAAFDAAIAADPQCAAAHCNRGAALSDLGRHAEAITSFSHALALNTAIAAAHFGRGHALHRLLRPAEAIADYDRALALGSNDLALHVNRAAAAQALRRFDIALESHAAALAIDPGRAAGHVDRGNLLWQMGEAAAALASFDAALAIEPGLARAWNNRGLAQQALGQLEAALASFDRAIAIAADDAGAHANRGEVLAELQRFDAAIDSLDRALALRPDFAYAAGQRLHLTMRLCDWRRFEADKSALIEGVRRGEPCAMPFILLGLCDDPLLHRANAAAYLADRYPADVSPPAALPRHERLRIGYFSADFHDHATMHLMIEMLEAHDRQRFEITAFSYGPDKPDPMRVRAKAACEHFRDVRVLADRDIAALARRLQIDIAVDLKGLTGGGRPGIFAARAAPAQINFLGYPGSMPAPYMDYLIADRTIIPAAGRAAIGERIIRLPDSYQPNCRLAAPAGGIDRGAAGLPATGFVYCCFSQTYKILPDVFATWMRILRQVEGSVLWLWAEHATSRANLCRAAEAHGIAAERLVFAGLVPRASHLARLPLAGLFLDTRPYGAHTTASDALRAGVPLVTCPGESFASRVAASLLESLDLAELIVPSLDAYADLAIDLGQRSERLAALRQRLASGVAGGSLFDPQRFARHLQAAYCRVDEMTRASAPPMDIVV